MKHSAQDQQLHNVMQFEAVIGDARKPFCASDLFAFKDLPGIWRRVKRSSQGLRCTRKNARLGLWRSQIVELLRDPSAEAELALAGFTLPAGTPPAEPPPNPDETPPALLDAAEQAEAEKGPDKPPETAQVPQTAASFESPLDKYRRQSVKALDKQIIDEATKDLVPKAAAVVPERSEDPFTDSQPAEMLERENPVGSVQSQTDWPF